MVYLLALCLTTFIWSITPFSWLYLVLVLISPNSASCLGLPTRLQSFLTLFASVEALFSVYYAYLSRSVQKRHPAPRYDHEFLIKVFDRSLSNGMDGVDWRESGLAYDDERAKDFRKSQEKWYHQASFESLKRDNVLNWLSWACFGLTLEEVIQDSEQPSILSDDVYPRSSSPSPASTPNLDTAFSSSIPSPFLTPSFPSQQFSTKISLLFHLLRLIELRSGFTFAEGRNTSVTEVRLTLDPVRVQSRPLLLYIITHSFNLLIRLSLRMHGFKRFIDPISQMSYLLRIPSNWVSTPKSPPPILFLHGLGMGLSQYYDVLHKLPKHISDRPILMLEQPHISMSLFEKNWLNPPTKHSTERGLRAIVKRHGFDKMGFVVLSHSNGTIVHGWLLKKIPEFIKRSIFVDPVCFCLWEPDICFNFLYAKPNCALDLLIQYFVGTELGIANTLQRYFDWESNILWPIHDFEMDPKKIRFYLAKNDTILDARRVEKYLLSNGAKKGEQLKMGSGSHGEAMILGDSDGGELFSFLKT